ncbi:hypothetical protein PMAYCL1PPCAC_27192, partial [Pristionchus mayeri]
PRDVNIIQIGNPSDHTETPSNRTVQTSSSSEVLPEQNQLEKADHSTDEARPSESLDTQSINEARTTGEMRTPPLSSPITSHGESGETVSIGQASGHLNSVDTQTQRDVTAIEIGNPSDHIQNPSLSIVESLGSAPLNEECTGLKNLPKVSDQFNGEVKEFTQKEKKRPRLSRVDLTKTWDGLEVRMVFFIGSNKDFCYMANLNMERFKISKGGSIIRELQVTLTGAEDPIIEQLADILSTSIKIVNITYKCMAALSSSDLSLCAKLLASSTIGDLRFRLTILDGTMTPFHSVEGHGISREYCAWASADQ